MPGRDIATRSNTRSTCGATCAAAASDALVEALFPAALALGKHVMIGGIDAANDASIRFHARLGFERVACFREVGHKFGRWLDLIFVQRFLDSPGSRRA